MCSLHAEPCVYCKLSRPPSRIDRLQGVSSRAYIEGGSHNANFDGLVFYPRWSLPGCVWAAGEGLGGLLQGLSGSAVCGTCTPVFAALHWLHARPGQLLSGALRST